MAVEVRVPTLGESVTEATVGTWYKQPGDAVAIDEMLCELETDKVTVEVPSPVSGYLGEHVAKQGETVGVDALLVTISEDADAATESATEPAKTEQGKPGPTLRAEPLRDEPGTAPGHRTDIEDAPSARRAMAEKGLAREDLSGSGRNGRVMKEDDAGAPLDAAPPVEGQPAAQPAPTPAAPGPDGVREKRGRMTRLRQTI